MAFKSKFSLFICLININLILDNKQIINESDSKTKNILKELKVNSYIKLTFYITTLKRSDVRNKNKGVTDLIIFIQNTTPEYFKIVEVMTKEITIDNIGENKLNKKRKLEDSENIPASKKRKLDNDFINWNEFISASSTRNFFLNDPLIDWLKEYNITSIKDVPILKECNSKGTVKYELEDPFTNFIMNQGNEFEKKVISIIKKAHPIVKVAETYQSTNIQLFKKTVEYMKAGKPIIFQGVLHNYKNKTYGAPDLLIRSDYINKFIGYELYTDTSPSIKLNVNWHYKIQNAK
jgi:hypothetical protein